MNYVKGWWSLSKSFLEQISAIDREVRKSPVVTPSKFWDSHAAQHVELLRIYGVENFKRTVAHNYYNWLTVSLGDPQIRRLLELWPVHGSMDVLTDTMEDPGGAGFPGSTGEYALKALKAQQVYRLGVSLLWDYTLHTDEHGVLEGLQEPLIGNPVRIWRGDRLLSQDLAHSVRERNTIADFSPIDGVVIGELGAGHGRLAHVFHSTGNCRYLIFDIAPALAVSQWYIENVFPEEKVFKFRSFEKWEEVEQEVAESRFAFFSANQLEKLPDSYFDIFINICSLMEMRIETIEHFFREIERTTRGLFYTKQWHEQNNRYDGLKIRKDDYPVPSRWKKLVENTDVINPRLFEQLWQT